MDERISEAITTNLDTYQAALFDLLRQPSISSTGEGMDACADLVGELFETYGFDAWRRVETSRYPLLYAERLVDEAKPTVLFYGHYDVQPPGDEARWDSPPFDPTLRDDAIYARGSGDNKGQFIAHLCALDALEQAREDGEPSVNVKCLIEGGEENGSVGLEEYLRDDHAEIDDVDLVYVADGPMHRSGRPTLIYGNRGLLSFDVRLRTANRDVHSGNFGGPVPSASNELVDLLGSLWDGTRIAVEGFYDPVDIPDAHRRLIETLPVDEAAIQDDLGIDEFQGDSTYYEQLLLEPTVTINGIRSGYTGDGMKTIRPADATAKLDVRLVPDQRPDEVFDQIRDHLTQRRPGIEVTKLGSFPPMASPVDTAAATLIRDCLADVWDTDPVEMPLLGGSIPAAYFRQALSVPVLLVPYANPDQNNHAPNEHLDRTCFRNGIETSARFLHRGGDRLTSERR